MKQGRRCRGRHGVWGAGGGDLGEEDVRAPGSLAGSEQGEAGKELNPEGRGLSGLHTPLSSLGLFCPQEHSQQPDSICLPS